MKNMSVPQMIAYVLLTIVLVVVLYGIAKQALTLPVLQQIGQAIADIFSGAAKSVNAA